MPLLFPLFGNTVAFLCIAFSVREKGGHSGKHSAKCMSIYTDAIFSCTFKGGMYYEERNNGCLRDSDRGFQGPGLGDYH